jgi:3-oxoacyl-[acyl-carrier protein] reductase
VTAIPSPTRTVLVTGAARGIGKAIADRFRAGGHIVHTPSRGEMDLADASAVRRYAQSKIASNIDILINNAAENVPVLLGQMVPEALARALDINVEAPLLLTSYLGTSMASRGWGRIVNISSVYSLVSRAGRTMYTTAKSAINGLTRSSAVELGPRGVLVNAVCPGFVDTDLTRQNNTADEIAALLTSVPLGRLADPAEIARLVYFLGSDENTYVTGQAIPIDGGFLCQ